MIAVTTGAEPSEPSTFPQMDYKQAELKCLINQNMSL